MRRLRFTDDGASAAEYSLLVAAIAGLLVVVLYALGANVVTLFTGTCESVASKAAPGETC